MMVRSWMLQPLSECGLLRVEEGGVAFKSHDFQRAGLFQLRRHSLLIFDLTGR